MEAQESQEGIKVPATIDVEQLVGAYKTGIEEGNLDKLTETVILSGGLARVLAQIEGQGKGLVARAMRENFGEIAKDPEALARYSAVVVGAVPEEAYVQAVTEYSVN